MKTNVYYLHALSPLHVGVGQGAGVIDLPIAREKATNLPFIPGSGLKGVLRDEMELDIYQPKFDPTQPITINDLKAWAETDKKQRIEIMFGPERVTDNEGAFAGALTVGDAHLLCLPVRSLAGTFAWATCPFILARYAREAKFAGIAPPALPPTFPDSAALTTSVTQLTHHQKVVKVVLEDLDLDAQAGADAWANHIAAVIFANDAEWQELFKQRFVILPDSVLDFLAETATDVRARVRIDDNTRVVAKGALWYEENLPAESLLYGVVAADASRKTGHTFSAEAVMKTLPSTARLQLGGKATVGRGLVNWIKRGN